MTKQVTALKAIQDLTSEVDSLIIAKQESINLDIFRSRATGLKNTYSLFPKNMRIYHLLINAGISVDVSANLSWLRAEIKNRQLAFEKDRGSILAGGDGDWNNKIRPELESLSRELGSNLEKAWLVFVESQFKGFDEIVNRVRLFSQIPKYQKTIATIDELIKEHDAVKLRLPDNESDISRPEGIKKELLKLSESFPTDYPEGVSELVRAITAKTASYEHMTEEVVAWLDNYNILKDIRIFWTG